MTLHVVPAVVRGLAAWMVVVVDADGARVHPMAMRDPASARRGNRRTLRRAPGAHPARSPSRTRCAPSRKIAAGAAEGACGRRHPGEGPGPLVAVALASSHPRIEPLAGDLSAALLPGIKVSRVRAAR